MISNISELYYYYPKDFEVDKNGKNNAWESIVKIPFINETILINTINTINHKDVLTDVEKKRNLLGHEYIMKPTDKAIKGIKITNDETVNNNNKLESKWGNAFIDGSMSRSHHSTSSSHSRSNPTSASTNTHSFKKNK